MFKPRSNNCRSRFWHIALMGMCVWLFVGGRGEAKADEGPTTTTITSKTMTANNKERRVIFRGSVVLTQGDLVVQSDVMIVVFKQKPTVDQEEEGRKGGHGRKVERIEARGHVVIEKAAGKAVCRYAVYYKDEEKIVLTGSPIAWQEGTRVSGKKMTMYLKENRSVVEGDSHVVFVEEEGA